MITLESSGKNLFKSSNKAFIYQTKNALFRITAFDNFSAFSSNSSINTGVLGSFKCKICRSNGTSEKVALLSWLDWPKRKFVFQNSSNQERSQIHFLIQYAKTGRRNREKGVIWGWRRRALLGLEKPPRRVGQGRGGHGAHRLGRGIADYQAEGEQ